MQTGIQKVMQRCIVFDNYEGITVTIKQKLMIDLVKFYKNDMLKMINHIYGLLQAILRDCTEKFVFIPEEYEGQLPHMFKTRLHFHGIVKVSDYQLYDRKILTLAKRIGFIKNKRMSTFRDFMEYNMYMQKHIRHNKGMMPILKKYDRLINVISPRMGRAAIKNNHKTVLGVKTIDILSYFQ